MSSNIFTAGGFVGILLWVLFLGLHIAAIVVAIRKRKDLAFLFYAGAWLMIALLVFQASTFMQGNLKVGANMASIAINFSMILGALKIGWLVGAINLLIIGLIHRQPRTLPWIICLALAWLLLFASVMVFESTMKQLTSNFMRAAFP